MKLRSGKIIGDKPVLSLGIKKLIEDDLKQLKESILNQSTYDYIIKSTLEIYTKHLSPIEVLDSIEKEVKYLVDDENSETWCSIYSLSTLINVSAPVLACTYYDDDFQNNEELKIKVAGEIYDFIHDNN